MYSSRNKAKEALQRAALASAEGKDAFHGGRLRGALRRGPRATRPPRPRRHIRAGRGTARASGRRREALRAQGGARPAVREAPQRGGDHTLGGGGGKHLRGDSRRRAGIGEGARPGVGAIL